MEFVKSNLLKMRIIQVNLGIFWLPSYERSIEHV